MPLIRAGLDEGVHQGGFRRKKKVTTRRISREIREAVVEAIEEWGMTWAQAAAGSQISRSSVGRFLRPWPQPTRGKRGVFTLEEGQPRRERTTRAPSRVAAHIRGTDGGRGCTVGVRPGNPPTVSSA